MKVIIVEPGKDPRAAQIGDSLEEMQAVVGGYIEAVHPFPDPVVIVCNEEGRLLDLPENRFGICGTFFICGVGEEDFTDFPEEMLGTYLEGMKEVK